MTMLAGLFDRQSYQGSLKADRMKRVQKEGSPLYRWVPGIIAATASSAIYLDTQFPDSVKYAPLDWVEVINNDLVDIDLTINGTEIRTIPAGVIRKVDDDIGLHHIAITNRDAALASVAGKIILSFQRKAMTADGAARMKYQ